MNNFLIVAVESFDSGTTLFPENGQEQMTLDDWLLAEKDAVVSLESDGLLK